MNDDCVVIVSKITQHFSSYTTLKIDAQFRNCLEMFLAFSDLELPNNCSCGRQSINWGIVIFQVYCIPYTSKTNGTGTFYFDKMHTHTCTTEISVHLFSFFPSLFDSLSGLLWGWDNDHLYNVILWNQQPCSVVKSVNHTLCTNQISEHFNYRIQLHHNFATPS